MFAWKGSRALRKARTRMKIPAVSLCILCLHSGLVAQDIPVVEPDEGVRVFGSVVNRATGEPIPSASVALALVGSDGESLWSGESDTSGRFRTSVLPLGGYDLRIEVLSFSPLSHLLVLPAAGIVDVGAQMVRIDFALEPIVVSARRRPRLETTGFYERREVRSGHFLSREDIENRAPSRISELFRTVPGARVIQGAFGRGNVIRLRGACEPLVVLDGIVIAQPVRLDELFPVMGIEGIEVYHGMSAPVQYAGMTTCGVIMLWSRDPTTVEGSGITWKRGLAAAGLAVLIVFGAR